MIHRPARGLGKAGCGRHRGRPSGPANLQLTDMSKTDTHVHHKQLQDYFACSKDGVGVDFETELLIKRRTCVWRISCRPDNRAVH